MDKLHIDKKNYVTFCAVAEYNGKLYISDKNNRGLLEYNLKTKETVIKNIFMAENYRNNYWSAFAYKNEIWFIPLRDYQKIAIYNTDNEKITFCHFPNQNTDVIIYLLWIIKWLENMCIYFRHIMIVF